LDAANVADTLDQDLEALKEWLGNVGMLVALTQPAFRRRGMICVHGNWEGPEVNPSSRV